MKSTAAWKYHLVVASAAVFLLIAAGCSVEELGLTDDSVPSSLGAARAVEQGEDAAGVTKQTQQPEADSGSDTESDSGSGSDTESDSESETTLVAAAASGQPNSDEGEGGGEDEESAPAGPRLAVDPEAVYRPGTCFQPPFPGADAEEVSCRDPHLIEVFASRLLPGGRNAPFPSADSSARLCDEDFSTISGVALGLATVFEGSVVRPSEETWAAGERDVTCYVVYPEETTEALALLDPLRSFGRVSLYGLRAGDCLIDFAPTDTSFELADCEGPHDAEVFADVELPAGIYPGSETIDPVAEDLCFGQGFTDFVGSDYVSSEIQSLRAGPSAETWALGHHHVACILTDGLVRVGSFAGTGP